MTVDQIIDDILKREGGYVNHSADRGGPTKYGITLATLCTWRKDVNLDAEDVANLSEVEAREIYRLRYVEPFDGIPESLLPFVADAAVNHGVGGAIKMLQQALGTSPDGVLGPATLAAAKSWEPKKLAAGFVAQRAKKYGRIVKADPTQAVFMEGWMNRLAEQVEALA